MAGMLYLVPTPIGNLGDISVRCRKTLAEADCIAAEDTRVTLKLLNCLPAPGADLGPLCAEAGITVCAIPGPCAGLTAFSISGLPTGRFCFEGFLSINKKSRREHLAGLKDERRTMIFYEAPHKLVNTLEDLAGAFGAERRISLCRAIARRRRRANLSSSSKVRQKLRRKPSHRRTPSRAYRR